MLTRQLLALALAIGLVTVPTVGARAPDPGTLTVPYSMFTLPNGLTVILHEDHSVPQVAVNVCYRVGSAYEHPGRTGLAHLFEHLMFEGSAHVKEGEFDTLLEAAGAFGDASTIEDFTDYFETVPANALDLALFLESDRMGFLLDHADANLVDHQRDVVKNELRQRFQNTPYGRAYLRMTELLYPPGHPYHWPVVGYMDDLTAATYDDVRAFFTKYYAPGNASLVLAGDIDPADARRKVEHWFADVKAGPPVDPPHVPAAELSGVVRETLPDHVELPRIFLAWLTPGTYQPGDAELDVASGILTGGKNARLYKRLVYDLQLAQDVSAAQNSTVHGSIFTIDITARPSTDPPAVVIGRLIEVVDEELDRLRANPPTDREVERVTNGIETSFMDRLQTIAGTASQMNTYYAVTGNPDYFGEDVGRYRVLSASDVQAAVRRWLPAGRRLELSVVPEGR